ncbi:MAG: hypothetical protein V4459_08035 [Pseudomonadota bacterium]
MSIRRFPPLAALALAACHAANTDAPTASANSADQVQIATVVARDYAARYAPDACLDSVTTARSGPEAIPHDLAQRTITWTYLARSGDGKYEALDSQSAAAIDAVWAGLRGGSYPSLTLPASALPPKPPGGCAKTLTLTSPMISGINAFVRWTDGTNRRTMALRKNAAGWAVVAEGPARIG